MFKTNQQKEETMTTEKKDYEIVDDYYHACNKRDKKLSEKWTK